MRRLLRTLRERYDRQSPVDKVMSAWRVLGLLPLAVLLLVIAVGGRDPWVLTATTVVLLANVPPHLYYYFRDSSGTSVRRAPRRGADNTDDEPTPRDDDR
jgi:hypothetical protein